MSKNSDDNTAYVWYDISTFELRHVGFKKESDHGIGLGVISVEFQLAVDIVSGKKKLVEFEVVDDDQTITLRQKKVLHVKPKFWELVDPESSRYDAAFGNSEDRGTPIRITDKNENSFVVDVIGKAKNIQFYITMRNDPNYLLKTIDLYQQALEAGDTVGIPITVDLGHDYSIYVRYDAT